MVDKIFSYALTSLPRIFFHFQFKDLGRKKFSFIHLTSLCCMYVFWSVLCPLTLSQNAFSIRFKLYNSSNFSQEVDLIYSISYLFFLSPASKMIVLVIYDLEKIVLENWLYKMRRISKAFIRINIPSVVSTK
jgi:hypothetical protein